MVRNHVLWFPGLSLFNRALPANYGHSPSSAWLLIARIFTYLRAGAVGGRWTDGGSMVQTSHPREVRQLGKRHRHRHRRAQVTPGHHLTAHTDRHTAVLSSPRDITWRHTQTDIQPCSGHPGHHLTAHTDRHTAVLRSPGDITWRHTQTDIQPGSGHPGHHLTAHTDRHTAGLRSPGTSPDITCDVHTHTREFENRNELMHTYV